MGDIKKQIVFFKGVPYLVNAIGLTLIYIFSGLFCVTQLGVPPDNYSLIWIPSGVGLLMFLILGNNAFIWILTASFAINSFSYFFLPIEHFDLFKLLRGFSSALIDVLQAFVAWKIVQKIQNKQNQPLFTRYTHLIPFFIFVCFFPALLTSGFLVLIIRANTIDQLNLATFFRLSIYLTVGNTIGLFLLAPLYFALKIEKPEALKKQGFPYFQLFVMVSIILISFYQYDGLIFLIIPAMVVLARRGNILHSIIAAFIVYIVLSFGTAHKLGFFWEHIDIKTSFETVLYLLTVMFMLYIETIAFYELKLHKENLQLLVDESVNTLEISEQRYRVLAENIAEVIWIFNITKEKFTYISPSVYQLRGVSVEEAMMTKIESSLEPKSALRVLNKIAEGVTYFLEHPEEKKFYYEELQQYKKDGTLIWIEAVTHLMKNKAGELELLGVSRDINARKKAEEIQHLNKKRLKELNATKDKFFSIIAHDLMSPFNTLIGFSNLVSRQAEKKEMDAVAISANLMKDAAAQTKELLVNLLEWSRTQTGSIAFNPEWLDIQLIIKEIISLLKVTAVQKGIELKFESQNESSGIWADKYMLSTILRNLISNAIKYTYPGGFVHVSFQKNANEWNFSVKDNGVGMTSMVCEHLFEIGAHKSEAGTQKEQGTGLGLILCKEFIEKHTGKIWVESSVGEGTKFYFTLPISSEKKLD